MVDKDGFKIVPVTCSRCGSRELAFVTDYHKSIACRLVSFLIIAFGAVLLVWNFIHKKTLENIDTSIIATLFFCFMFWGIIKLFQIFIEAKTHIRVICKDCGNTWTID